MNGTWRLVAYRISTILATYYECTGEQKINIQVHPSCKILPRGIAMLPHEMGV